MSTILSTIKERPVAITGLVVTLSGDSAESGAAREAMEQHALLNLGEPKGRKLPVVADTPSKEDDLAVWHWLNELAGVEFVDVVYVHLEEGEGSAHEHDG